jgi:hypothetical protein
MLEKTLALLFRTQETRKIALALLTEVRDRQNTENPYSAEEYHDFCRRHDFKESSYQNVVSTLRNCGLLVKSGGHHGGRYDINYHFPLELAGELFKFLGAKYRHARANKPETATQRPSKSLYTIFK